MIKSEISKIILACSITMLSACSALNAIEPAPVSLDLYDPLKEGARTTTKNTQSDTAEQQPAQTVATPSPDKLIYYRGRSGALNKLGDDSEDRLVGRTLQLNFVNAPAGDATRTIIRDTLGETVSIADGVGGVITLTAPEAVSAREALNALELALAESGLVLLELNPGYLLTTIQEASDTPQAPGARAPIGYSTTIAPVQFGVPSEIVSLIEPFMPDRVSLTPNNAESVIVVRGPKIDTDEALDAIKTFDAPYLTDRIFGLFKLEFADANTIKTEVESLLAASGLPQLNGTTLISLPRLNLLFVSTRTREAFTEARSWVERFDQPSGGDQRRLRYHLVQYTPAETLASQLSSAFGGVANKNIGGELSSEDGGSIRRSSPQSRSSQQIGLSPAGDRASISADTLNNALLIRATDQEFAEILSLIQKMDVPAPQVLIEATIAEVTLTDDLAYGVRWFFENAESSLSFPQGPSPSNALNPIVPGLNYSYFDNNVGVALDTLASVTDVTVLSAPSIMVLNNQTANLQVGDEVPIVTQQAQSVIDGDAPIVSSLQLRETGVILEVKPRVNASDVVVIEVTQEVSDVAQTTTSGIDSPTIQQRRFTSTVSVRDKGTVALGGLIRETYTDNSSGIPILKDIPVLGYPFKSRDITKRRTELIVFLTPHIIRNESDASAAFKKLRQEMRNLYQDDQTPTN